MPNKMPKDPRGKKKKDPWDKKNPKSPRRRKTLTPGQKSAAKKRAAAAGRPYPNLVDNMAASGSKPGKGRFKR